MADDSDHFWVKLNRDQLTKLYNQIDGIPEKMQGDERRLKQILYNLLSNPVKFTPTEGQSA